MEKQQREFLLRQQMAAIRKELAELDGKAERGERTTGPASRRPTCPSTCAKAALAEVDKLERTSEQSPEVGWIRTWLDTVLELPWNERTEDSYDIREARAVLDADHAGLDDVKERITEYLAVRAARGPWSRCGRRTPQRRRTRRWSVLPAWVRPRWASPSPVRWAGSSSGSHWAVSGTRPRSAVTGVRTSVRCRAGSSGPSPRPGR